MFANLDTLITNTIKASTWRRASQFTYSEEVINFHNRVRVRSCAEGMRQEDSNVGRKAFREFLKCEYSEENILFWQACEDLKKELNPSLVEEKARLIYEDYISILSPKEVSLDSRVREIINRNMVDPTTHTFDEAQNQIYTLMHRDSYPRFLNSPHYKRLAQLNNNGSGGGGTGSGLSLGSGQTHRKESTS
ncbi:Regulator of G-protein signaling 20 [Armadillidium nasatum]|uniref:Regulator of G-protein signaling 20 n=1 Tax=Armadillidium nasatum TaxID=96803 RepID=A0A5N5SRW3_9CRUS|nr:Regulator of G-protein signaling 20 [Armadillidium nasatum]